MTEKIAELKKDIADLTTLQLQATRPKVIDILSIELRKLSSEVLRLEEEQRNCGSEVTKAEETAVPTSKAPQKRYQIKLNNYAWDQTSKYVKFYVTLKNVQAVPAENVQCSFTSKSLELTVKDVENKDYVLTINKLLYTIIPELSIWKVKTDMVIISVAKLDSVSWSHVTELEKRLTDAKKKLPETDKNADPSEGLMSIMRNMYEQGDPEMKRTIAKAWTESQSKGPAF